MCSRALECQLTDTSPWVKSFYSVHAGTCAVLLGSVGLLHYVTVATTAATTAFALRQVGQAAGCTHVYACT